MKKLLKKLNNKITKVLVFLLILLGLSILLKNTYKLFKVNGSSMDNTYKSGEKLWVSKATYQLIDPERNDIIVCYLFDLDEILIKRIIGVPGDTIEIIEGHIFLNGFQLEDEFSHLRISLILTDLNNEPLQTWETGNLIYEYTNEPLIELQKNEYWIIGDNRESSWYGIIDRNEIIGKSID